jgi:hypothetical protein
MEVGGVGGVRKMKRKVCVGDVGKLGTAVQNERAAPEVDEGGEA